MRALVTGANGLVGSRVCQSLSGKGHEVLAVSRGDRTVAGPFEYRGFDITDRPRLEEIFSDFRPDVVINAAAAPDVDGCERDREGAFSANVLAPALLAQLTAQSRAHLIQVSTDYVFDGERGDYSEDDVPNPRGVYSLTKHMGEQAVRALGDSWCIARTAVVFGWPSARRPNFGSWLVTTLARGAEVRLFEDQVVAPSLAENVGAMLTELAERRLKGIWHTAGGDPVDRVTFGRKVCEVFGFDPKLILPTRLREMALPSPRPLRSFLNTEKAKRELTAKPAGIDESLRAFHRAYRGLIPRG